MGSTGSVVLLLLRNLQVQNVKAEVLICGGAPNGAFQNANLGRFDGALKTCTRNQL